MAIRERVPKRLRSPLGFTSFGIMLIGVAVGYIVTILGITLYFDMNGLGDQITNAEAIHVTLVGVVSLVIGYFGWKGFLYFSY